MNTRQKKLLEAINSLKKSEKNTTTFSDFMIVKVPNSMECKSDDENKYYAIYTGGASWRTWWKQPGLIGEGGFGSVFLTFTIKIINKIPNIIGFDFEKNRAKMRAKKPEIDPDTQKPYPIYVTKMVNYEKLQRQIDAKNMLLTETELLGRYYRAEPCVVQAGSNALIISEFLTGEKLSPAVIKKLNYTQRLALIQEILLNINLIHHETILTGAAFVHKDIKPDNIHFFIEYNTPEDPKSGVKSISAYLMDFGLARILENDNPHCLFRNNPQWGTIGYIAPEVYHGPAGSIANGPEDIGLKSDIYSLTPVLLMMLGAKDPIKPHVDFFNKAQIHPFDLSLAPFQTNKTLPEYDFSGIFEGFAAPDPTIQSLLIQMLKRMQSNDYHSRPTSDQLLKFFNILRKYEILSNNSEFKPEHSQSDKNIYLANLILLTHGQWSQEYEEQLSEDSTNTLANIVITAWQTNPGNCLEVETIFRSTQKTLSNS